MANVMLVLFWLIARSRFIVMNTGYRDKGNDSLLIIVNQKCLLLIQNKAAEFFLHEMQSSA